jgi:hypothetical protein
LCRAKAAVRIYLLPRALQIDLNVEAHFTSAEAKSFIRLYFNIVRSRSEPKVAYLTDGVVAFADDNVSITFTPSLESDSHFPQADGPTFDDRVRRHIKVLDAYAVAPSAAVATSTGVCGPHFRCEIDCKRAQKSSYETCFNPKHRQSSILKCYYLDVRAIQVHKL